MARHDQRQDRLHMKSRHNAPGNTDKPVNLTVCLNQKDPSYPAALSSYLGKDVPVSISALGNLDILSQSKLAVFCSAECPAELILPTHDLVQTTLTPSIAVISGFHSRGERECLSILLRRTQPIIICPARSLNKMRIRTEYKKPLDQGRLLLLSFFRSHRHRSDIHMALSRNRFVAAMADRILSTPLPAAKQKDSAVTFSVGESPYLHLQAI
jgi:predicted Rossmann fold nucleotide-binding protein DprA/Smf involved in DNA uptake